MSKGFTIIELIISIFILTVAVVGIFSAFSVMTILTSDSVNRLTATYLAQEGIEIVRNLRDTNWISMDNCSDPSSCPSHWDDGITGCDSLAGCTASYTTGSTYVASPYPVTPWSSSDADYLYLNSNGFYGDNTTGTYEKTRYKRKIIITPIADIDTNSDHILKVEVQVSWDQKATILNSFGASADNCNTSGGVSNCVEVEETLYDWFNYSTTQLIK